MRGVGVVEILAGLVPEWFVPVVFALTQLGDPWFVVGSAALAYWIGPRYRLLSARDGARIVAVAIGVLAFVEAAKAFFGLPRPPAPITNVPKHSLGFPSGHATGSAAIYGSFAALLDRWRPRLRYAAAAGLVVLVSLSRLLLGVHYLVDVVVGALLGAVFGWAVLRATRERVVYGFLAAAGFGVVALGLTGVGEDSVVATGYALGATGAWVAVRDRLPPDGATPALAVGGVVVVGALSVAALRLALPPWAAAISGVVGGAGLVALPAVQNFSR